MKAVHWLFAVSACLFICSIGFVVASARTLRNGPAAAASVAVPVPIASVKQIMQGIVKPASLVVFNSVGTVITKEGTEERQPRTPEEWTAVGDSAAALIESANLMMMGSRAVDQGEWIKMSRDMIEASQVALRAIEKQDAAALFDSGEGIYLSCEACHKRYQRQ
ncbi:MAG TPA: hypothetical protein VJP86_05875 [Vicinamibacterales bacterium]|nr:hypothetical protein [Vicinamibacterales bacterium]